MQHEADAGLSGLSSSLREWGEIHEVAPNAGNALPASAVGFDGLIVLGGSMDPDDDHASPWLPAVLRLLKDAVEQRVPVLGICLGAQLLTRALGGGVRRMVNGPEVGAVTIERTTASVGDALLGRCSASTDEGFEALQWHWFEMVPPRGATILARNQHCGVQAFRVGKTSWGVQFHPEATPAQFADWARDDAESLRAAGLDPDRLIEEVLAAGGPLADTRDAIAHGFRAVIAASVSNART